MKSLSVILLLLFIGTLSSTFADQDTGFHALFTEGRQKYGEKDWARAQIAFRNAVRLAETDDERALAQIYLGHSYRIPCEFDHAISAYEDVLKLKTVSASHVYQAQMGLAAAAINSGDEERARRAYQAILADDGMNVLQRCQTHLQLANSHARDMQHEEAKASIMAALELEQVPLRHRVNAIIQLGNLFYTQDDFPRAREAYESILILENVSPDQSALAQHRVGLTWFGEKRFDEALETLRKATAMEGNGRNLAESILYIGLSHIKKEEFEKARAELERIPHIKHAASWHIRTANAQLEHLDALVEQTDVAE